MFDFERLEVYQEIRKLNRTLLPLIFTDLTKNPYLADQLQRASMSIMLNLAEGTGRMSSRDKKQFYIRSRASVNECVAILQILLDLRLIDKVRYNGLYEGYERISKMMLGMIRNISDGDAT